MLTRTTFHKAVVAELNADRVRLQGDLAHTRGELAVARALLQERESRIERLEQDISQSRSDLQQAILLLGNMAQRPTGKTLFDEDIFREDHKLPDTFLSPAPEDFISGEEILQELDEQRGN